MRTRVYETKKLSNGKRIVSSQSLDEYMAGGILYGIFWFFVILPLKIMWWIVKALWWIVTLPVRFIIYIIKKNKSRNKRV